MMESHHQCSMLNAQVPMNAAMPKFLQCNSVIDNSLNIDNCQLSIATTKGVAL